MLVTSQLGLAPGQTLALGDRSAPLTVRVAGVWSPRSASDPFWNGRSFVAVASGPFPPVYPLLFTQPGFFRFFAPLSMPTTPITPSAPRGATELTVHSVF